MRKIIDAQSHYMPPDVAKNTTFFKVHWSDIDRHLEVMEKNNVEKTLLLYPTSDAHLNMGGWGNVCRAYNDGIAKITKKYASRFIGAGILPVDNPKSIPEELKKLEALGLRVISLASSYEGKYLDDEMFFPIYEFAQSKGMPIHVHPQIINPIGEDRVKDPLLTPVLEYVFDVSMCIGKMMMSGIFTGFSKVNFIFAHYGGVLPIVKERFNNTYIMLRKRNFVKDIEKNPSEYFKNLYYDTSGSKSSASLRGILEVTDASHVLWASDHPANQDMANCISVIDGINLAEEEKNAILSSNLEKLLGS